MMTLLQQFFLKRFARLLFLLAVVSVGSFVLAQQSPIDPVSAYIGADMLQIGQEQRTLIAKRWGLDQPPLTRFLKWAGQLVRGNFGRSMIYNEPVLMVIGKRFLTSFWLMALAWLLSGALGFILGVVSGVYEGSWLDKAISLYSYTLASTPTFWIGMVLLSVFSVTLGWTPICCATPPGVLPEDATLWQRAYHLILPSLTLSIIGIANITLHTREKMLDIMHGEYVLFAKAQGDSLWGIAWHHAIRNAALPAITLQFASLGELFGGSVLAEQVFSYPGLGKATVEAGIRGDVPLLLGITLFSTLFVFAGNTAADLSYLVIDPRIKMKGARHVASA